MVGDKSGPLGGFPATRGFFSLVFGGRGEEASASRNPTWGGGGTVLPPTNPNLTLSPINTTTTTTIQTSLKHVS